MRVAGTLPYSWDWSLDRVNFTLPEDTQSLDRTWKIYEADFPASQANGATMLTIYQDGAGSGNYYIDGIQVEAKDGYKTTYCDGEEEGCEWNGEENASTSSRSVMSLAGGRIRNFETDYGFYVERMVSIGAGPVGFSTDGYATLPGGFVSNDKDEIREFVFAGKMWARRKQTDWVKEMKRVI